MNSELAENKYNCQIIKWRDSWLFERMIDFVKIRVEYTEVKFTIRYFNFHKTKHKNLK